MIIDERFIFYCLGLICGFVLLEIFRVVQVFRARRGQPVRESKSTGQGYKHFVDNWRKTSFNK
jgi:hypothetical protein